MPLPTLLFLTFGSGIAASVAGRSELRVSPRPPLLTRSFGAYLLFACLVAVPITVYFYVFHGDWFLLYLIDVRRVPSALALLGFLLEIGVGTLGFGLGSLLVRNQRETAAGVVAGIAILASVSVVVVVPDRLAEVGTFDQFHGDFGLNPFLSDPVFHGMLAMLGLFVAGAAYLLLRLRSSGRRL